MISHTPVVVCVPARNEAQRLPILLKALAVQSVPASVVVALNNTTDDSCDVVDRARRNYPILNIVIDTVDFPPDDAHAGSARRQAMDVGSEIAGPHGVLISTDADTRPPPHWIESNLAALERGLDIVGGQIRLDEDERISPRLRSAMSATARYWARVRDIEDAIDPIYWDPPPRHGDHTGASLALRSATYGRCGGVPRFATGEDRGLVHAVCRAGGLLGHPLDVWTRVSSRTRGRASGGMAQDMERILMSAAIELPDFVHWLERAPWRQAVRDRFGPAEVVMREQALPPMPCDLILSIDESAIA